MDFYPRRQHQSVCEAQRELLTEGEVMAEFPVFLQGENGLKFGIPFLLPYAYFHSHEKSSCRFNLFKITLKSRLSSLKQH